MKNNPNILLATDYSASVKSAENYAVRFAKNVNSDLTLLHVANPSIIDEQTTAYREKEMEESVLEEQNKIEAHGKNILLSSDLSPTDFMLRSVFKEGNASQEILNETKKTKAAFIVMGAHRENGFMSRIFNNHTWDVVNDANVPVIIVPESASFREWKNIVFATEYRRGEMPVIKFLSRMARRIDAELTILHISNFALMKEMEIRLFDTFLKKVKLDIFYRKIFFRMLRNNEITDGLNRFCLDHDVDLLVLSPQKQTLLKKIFSPDPSVTKQMTYKTKISLMTIPDGYRPENKYFLTALANSRKLALHDM